MGKNPLATGPTRTVAGLLGGILLLLLLMLAMGDVRVQAVPLRQGGTGSDPAIEAITLTASIPISDTRPGEGIHKTVYFNNQSEGVITVTLDISGTPTLTLTAGAAFGDGEQILTSSEPSWSPVVTYSVETGDGDYPAVAYTATNTDGVQTTVVITYVRDITSPVISNPQIEEDSNYIHAIGTSLYYTNTMASAQTFTVTGRSTDELADLRNATFSQAFGNTPPEDSSPQEFTAVYSIPTGSTETGVITATVFDNVGNFATQTYTYTLDGDPPTGSVIITGNIPLIEGQKYTSTLTVTLQTSATDSGAGVAQMCVNNDPSCPLWETYAITKEWTLPNGDGLKTVYVWYRDNVGNTSNPFTDTVFLDGTPPVISSPNIAEESIYICAVGTALYYSNTMQVAHNFEVRGIATDTLAGLWKVTFSTAFGDTPSDDMSPADFTGLYSIDKGSTETGVITATVYDRVSNTALQTYTYDLDNVAPTGAITIAGGAEYVATTTVSLSLPATDPKGCGVTQMCVSDTSSCSSWGPYAATISRTLPNGDGPKTVYVWYRDGVDNTSGPFTDTVFLDRTPPTVVVTAPAQIATTTFPISWTASYSGAGVVSYTVAYQVDGGTWQTWLVSTTQTSATFISATLEHTYVFSVTAYDRAGNRAAGSATTRVAYFRVYIPLTMRHWVWWYQYDIYEPNNSRAQAWGPLQASTAYTSYIYVPDDRFDFYTITVSSAGSIVITLDVPDCCDYDLYLYDSLTGNYVAASNYTGKGRDEQITYSVQQGTYYVLVYSPYKDYSSTAYYTLQWRMQ